ncbi:MAG: MotA/TolQ/ExbB proton channel family protein [Deferribacteres bacterium]|nr:MotA/TolQ/ExbB proton channel family protein [Deferribacteres bacterium]
MDNRLILWIQQGGIIMYPILLCSVIALAVFMERLVAYRKSKIIPERFVKELEKAGADPEEIKKVCLKYDTPLSRIILTGVKRAKYGWLEATKAMESVGQHEIAVLARELRALSTIGNVAPMLGFLGTVLGMIQAFSTIAKVGTGKPELIASGISEALITTAAGLIVGIPSILAFNFLRNKLDKLSTEMEEIALRVIDRLTEQKP